IGVVCMRVWRATDGVDEPTRIERITCATLVATIVLWLTGKVFSPQYLTWGIPLVLAIPGRRGVQAIWIAVLACAVTELYHRGYYDFLANQRPAGVITLLVRQAILAGLMAFVARGVPAAAARISTPTK